MALKYQTKQKEYEKGLVIPRIQGKYLINFKFNKTNIKRIFLPNIFLTHFFCFVISLRLLLETPPQAMTQYSSWRRNIQLYSKKELGRIFLVLEIR